MDRWPEEPLKGNNPLTIPEVHFARADTTKEMSVGGRDETGLSRFGTRRFGQKRSRGNVT